MGGGGSRIKGNSLFYSLQKYIATIFYEIFPPGTYVEISRKPTKGQLLISESTILNT